MHNMFKSSLNIVIVDILSVILGVRLRPVTHIEGWFYTFVTNRSVFRFVSQLGEGTDFLKQCVAHAAVQLSLFYKVHGNIVDRQCCRLVC